MTKVSLLSNKSILDEVNFKDACFIFFYLTFFNFIYRKNINRITFLDVFYTDLKNPLNFIFPEQYYWQIKMCRVKFIHI